MWRYLSVISLVCAVTMMTGCRLGYTPYDLSGATFSNRNDSYKCSEMYRAGSVFSGYGSGDEDGSVFLQGGEYSGEYMGDYTGGSDCADCNTQKR